METSNRNYAHNIRIDRFFSSNFPKTNEMMLQKANSPLWRTKKRENEAMTTQIHHQTAQILQFRPRQAGARNEGRFAIKSGMDIEVAKTNLLLSCDSWYHEAAVRGDAAPRKS